MASRQAAQAKKTMKDLIEKIGIRTRKWLDLERTHAKRFAMRQALEETTPGSSTISALRAGANRIESVQKVRTLCSRSEKIVCQLLSEGLTRNARPSGIGRKALVADPQVSGDFS
jgi:hypothetical protein